MRKTRYFIYTLLMILSFSTFAQNDISQIASSKNQWTGLTKSEDGRLFVNFPRWSDDVPISVGEIVDGKVVPFPDKEWNHYDKNSASINTFICVQSVFVDKKNRLWVLDPANPQFGGVLANGPRLYQFDLNSNQHVETYTFDKDVYFENSYLNDVRIDTEKEIAYITDSNVGGIITLDLESGESHRYLTGHTSVQPEADYLRFENGLWKNKVASDGIALSPDNEYLYYAALTGHSLYRIPTEMLNKKISAEARQKAVERLASVHATDGMLFDDDGNLYMGALEEDAVYAWTKEGNYVEVARSPKIQWTDSFTKDENGNFYFTTSQLHLSPEQRGTYKIYRIDAEIPQKSNPRILMVITSHGVLGEEEGKPTGYYLSEVSHAYYVFKDAGYDVDFVSPKGGKSPVDGYDLDDEENQRFVNDKEAQQKINNAITPGEVNISDYRAVYYAGGHGTMWDLPENEGLASLTAKEYETGGVVGAVCHGPAGLVNVKLSDSTYLVEGKTVSAFTNEEEVASGKDKYVPFMLESKLEERGAKHVKSENWQKKVAVDGRLVTGQNPASAKGVAEEMVRLLGKSSK